MRKAGLALLSLGAVLLGGCEAVYDTRGNLPDPDFVLQIQPGVDNRFPPRLGAVRTKSGLEGYPRCGGPTSQPPRRTAPRLNNARPAFLIASRLMRAAAPLAACPCFAPLGGIPVDR